tara:strand:+ start:1218 stop:1580 length:363 start_codon:yes stop_codon:yes gene_type:complete
MIKNKIHYQITGNLKADFGQTVNNPVIKVDVSDKGVVLDGLLKCEYNIYMSIDAYNEGMHFFKARLNGERAVNFTYPITNVLTWSIMTYAEDQRKIISDTFSLDIENVQLVIEETEEDEE